MPLFSRSRWIGIALAPCIVWLLAALWLNWSGSHMPYRKADLAVVFGNGLNKDGTPQSILERRLDAALSCYRDGLCPLLFVSGSIDGPGLDEAESMRAYLVARGVAPDRIVVDNKGDNTLASARNAVAFMRERNLSNVMLVTQRHHLPRARLAFDTLGVTQISGTYPRAFRRIDLFSSWREVPALALYRVRLGLNPDAQPVSFRPLWIVLDALGIARN